jgi:geranylgeranyl diphosphate synthase type II
VNDYLNEKISGDTYPQEIYEAMRYSINSGGKRLRPLLAMYTAEGFNGDIGLIVPFAAAVECIHSYSLIHDDLPCLDNDDLRRGKPTNHKVFGEAMALLAGDSLLNLAYEIMAEACTENSSKNAVFAMREVAVFAGVCGMIGGQVIDVLSENKGSDKDSLLYIQKNKTAALIKAAMVSGAILSDATESEVAKIKDAGDCFGIAFQIKDDLLDVEGSTEVLGKNIGSDEKNGKLTHVSVYGLEKAKVDYEDYSVKALSIIKELELKSNSLEVYMSQLIDRNF